MVDLALTRLIEHQRRQRGDEAEAQLRRLTQAEVQERLCQQVAEVQRKSQDLIVAGGVLLLVGLAIMSQSGT